MSYTRICTLMCLTHILPVISLWAGSELTTPASSMNINFGELAGAATELTNAATNFTNAISNATPGIQALMDAGKDTSTEVLQRTDATLARHLPAIERIVTTLSLFAPSDATLTKYSTRGLTTATSALSLYLGYQATQSFAKYKSAQETQNKSEQTRFFWKSISQLFFSTLTLSVATYLYFYHWDAHLALNVALAQSNVL